MKISTLNKKEIQNSLNEVRILASIHDQHIVEYKVLSQKKLIKRKHLLITNFYV